MVLNNSQYDALMRIYNAKQLKAKNDTDRRMAEVLLAIPEMKGLLDSVSTITFEAAKRAIRGEASDTNDLHKQLNEISDKKKNLLISAGFAPDYLEPVYECINCQDTGYVNGEKCTCFKQAAINLLYKQSNIQHKLQHENFNKLSFKWYSKDYVDRTTGLTPLDNAKKVVNICMEYVKDFPCGDNLLFYGDTGVGKTFLSNCIAKEILDNAHSVLYMTAIDLFEYFAKSMDSYDTSYEDKETCNQILDCDLLIIDDLGTELSNAFTNSKLFYCINSRLIAKKSTIISTNLSLEELMRNYSERIFSRITSSYKLLKLFGEDIRLKKNKTEDN